MSSMGDVSPPASARRNPEVLRACGIAMCAPPWSSAVTLVSVLTQYVVPRRAARADAILFRAGEAAAGRAVPLGLGSFGVPDAVVCRIFLMMPPRSKGVCTCVCASWRDALDGPELWDTPDVDVESIKSKMFLEVVRRARGQLKTLRVRGVVDNYDKVYGAYPSSNVLSSALVEACASNPKLAQLSVESAISLTQAEAVFASCPAVDFVARVAMVQRSLGMHCTVKTIVGLLENSSDVSGRRVVSLSLNTSHAGFWGDAFRDVGMYSLASALASHKALQHLTFTCPDVLAAPVVSRLCAACVGLTSLTFKNCRMEQAAFRGWESCCALPHLFLPSSSPTPHRCSKTMLMATAPWLSLSALDWRLRARSPSWFWSAASVASHNASRVCLRRWLHTHR